MISHVQILASSQLQQGDDPRSLRLLAESNGYTIHELFSFLNNRGESLLMLAAKYGRVSCCSFILRENPASIAYKNHREHNALHLSCYEGHRHSSMLLLSAGCNPFDINMYGETCDEAARNGGNRFFAEELALEIVRPVQSVHRPLSFASAFKDLAVTTRGENLSLVQRFSIFNQARTSLPIGQRFFITGDGVDVTSHPSPSSTCYDNKPIADFFSLEVITCDEGVDPQIIGSIFNIDLSISDVCVGRSSSNEVCLRDLSISKRHCALSFHLDLGFYVRDLGSTHGTFVNGFRLSAHKPVITITTATELDRPHSSKFISEGDLLQVGRVCLRLQKQRKIVMVQKGFVPNAEFGAQLLVETRRRHAIDGTRKKKMPLIPIQEYKKSNRTFIEQATAGSVRNHDPEVRNFAQCGIHSNEHTEVVGASILQKMGWTPGKGLGRTEAGISDFVRVSARAARAGLGSTADDRPNAVLGENSINSGPYFDRSKIRKLTQDRYAAVSAST